MEDKIARMIEEEIILPAMAKDTEMPEEIIEFIKTFVHCGCPLKSVLEGILKFSERPTKKEIDELKELLKDLPIKFEEE